MFPWKQEGKLCHPAGLSEPPSWVHFIVLQSPREGMWGLGPSPVSTPTKVFQRYWREETGQTGRDTPRYHSETFFVSKWAFLHLQSFHFCLHKVLYTPHNEVLASTAQMESLPPASTAKAVSPVQLLEGPVPPHAPAKRTRGWGLLPEPRKYSQGFFPSIAC